MYKNVTLEVSLKPFKQTDEAYIRKVCEEIFVQWYPLVKDCESVSVMLWTSDGSEMLDYAGDLDDSFDWCKYLGTANLPYNTTDDPSISLHSLKFDYMQDENIQPGETVTIALCYALRDQQSPVEFEVYDYWTEEAVGIEFELAWGD